MLQLSFRPFSAAGVVEARAYRPGSTPQRGVGVRWACGALFFGVDATAPVSDLTPGQMVWLGPDAQAHRSE